MTTPINPMALKRTELIEALRSFTPPSKYQKLTYEPTAKLRAMLAYYQSTEDEKKDYLAGMKTGLDTARGPELVMIIHDEVRANPPRHFDLPKQ